MVKFQIGVARNGEERAVSVAAVRKYIRARVESVKDKVGGELSLARNGQIKAVTAYLGRDRECQDIRIKLMSHLLQKEWNDRD